MNDRQISALWSSIGPFSALYIINMFWASRNPGSGGISGWFLIPAKNAESTCYFGALIGAMLIAFLAWLAAIHARRHPTEGTWWKRLPPTLLEGKKDRSSVISQFGGGVFLVLPALFAVLLAVRATRATIVRWEEGTVAADGIVSRLFLAADQCPWLFHQCFKLGNREGIEYKPVLSDGAMIVAFVIALYLVVRLLRALTANRP